MALISIDWKPGPQQLRTFGAICSVASLALGLSVLWRHAFLGMTLAPDPAARVGYLLVGMAAGFATVSWLAPRALSLLYVVLTAITLPIGLVLSYVLVAALFFLVLTPIGLVFRLFGRDPLKRKLDIGSTSYWTPRLQMTDITRYYHQY